MQSDPTGNPDHAYFGRKRKLGRFTKARPQTMGAVAYEYTYRSHTGNILNRQKFIPDHEDPDLRFIPSSEQANAYLQPVRKTVKIRYSTPVGEQCKTIRARPTRKSRRYEWESSDDSEANLYYDLQENVDKYDLFGTSKKTEKIDFEDGSNTRESAGFGGPLLQDENTVAGSSKSKTTNDDLSSSQEDSDDSSSSEGSSRYGASLSMSSSDDDNDAEVSYEDGGVLKGGLVFEYDDRDPRDPQVLREYLGAKPEKELALSNESGVSQNQYTQVRRMLARPDKSLRTRIALSAAEENSMTTILGYDLRRYVAGMDGLSSDGVPDDKAARVGKHQHGLQDLESNTSRSFADVRLVDARIVEDEARRALEIWNTEEQKRAVAKQHKKNRGKVKKEAAVLAQSQNEPVPNGVSLYGVSFKAKTRGGRELLALLDEPLERSGGGGTIVHSASGLQELLMRNVQHGRYVCPVLRCTRRLFKCPPKAVNDAQYAKLAHCIRQLPATVHRTDKNTVVSFGRQQGRLVTILDNIQFCMRLRNY